MLIITLHYMTNNKPKNTIKKLVMEEEEDNINKISSNHFSELSIKLTKNINNDVIKAGGIYFTPPSIIQKNIDRIIKKIKNIDIQHVLEPSCGSCEYVNAIDKKYSDINITAIELNKDIYDAINTLMFENNVSLINVDFLKFQTDMRYDLIIGNPPYFVMNKDSIDKKYKSYFDGRPNIFIIFIIKCLELLNDNGVLSFVLPNSFINCLYYDKLRKFVFENYKIIDIMNCSDDIFLETQQETVVFIIQKNPNNQTHNSKFTMDINNYTIFNTRKNIKKIRKLYENSTTLMNLGFGVNVGTVVWNQCKQILTDDNSATRLIYSSDIVEQQLITKKYKNNDKKNYIKKEGLTNPLLVINRGYGKGKYKLDYCLIDVEEKYLIENHLICINYTNPIEKSQLLEMYKKLILSLNDDRTTEFINLYFGNNAINCSELRNVLPIYYND